MLFRKKIEKSKPKKYQDISIEDFLTPMQLSEYIGITEGTLAIWRSSKKHPELKYIKMGGKVRYRKSDVEEFLKTRTIGGDK